MRNVARAAMLEIPAIRRLYDGRNHLLKELAALRGAVAATTARAEAAEHELALAAAAAHTAIESARDAEAVQKARGTHDNFAQEIRELQELRRARGEHRLIVTEYPYHPAERPLAERAGGQQIEARFRRDETTIANTLRGVASHVVALGQITREPETPLEPFWVNDWFPPFDGSCLYGLIAENRPRRYIEVGSGISTRFARRAVRDGGLSTKIISIDPHPHNATDGLCDETVICRMEDMPTDFWASLTSDDMLFIDNSHRAFPASDVTVFFTEVMPALPAGVVYGIHDIFLPWDYPNDWRGRFYSEQYLLMSYLLGGGGNDQILLPVCWATRRPALHGLLSELWSRGDLFSGITTHGGAFWARRGRLA